MIIETQPTDSSAVKDWLPRPDSVYRLSVEQYEAMIRSGVFTKRDRLHLINGILVAKMTKKPPHVIGCESYRSSVHLKPGQIVPLIIDGAEVGQILVDDMLPRPS